MLGLDRAMEFIDPQCRLCGLCQGRTQVVPPEGPRTARAFFVGEAPGPDEDAQGRPFIGRAGRILRGALSRAGWKMEDVWITNAVKCFPHEAVGGKKRIRAPEPSEAEACRPFLAREIESLRPRLVVALGRTAARSLTGRNVALDQEHGTVLLATAELHGARVFLTFHPSGLHYAKGRAEAFEEDLRHARLLLEEAP